MAILASEAEYARQLAAFLSGMPRFLLKPVVFTDAEAYLKYQKENRIDLLLCDEEIRMATPGLEADRICLLSEYSHVREEEGDEPSIFKYQSSEKVAEQILDNYAAASQCAVKTKTPAFAEEAMQFRECASAQGKVAETSVLCVCSPLGDRKSSTYALALAEHHARRRRTLFISFDPFFSIPGRPAGGNVSELIYRLQTGEDIGAYIEEKAVRPAGAECLSGMNVWLDREDLTDLQVGSLLDAVTDKNMYGQIVIDTGGIDRASLAAAERADKVYVPRKKGKKDDEVIRAWKSQLVFSGHSEIAGKLRERMIPLDRGLEDGVSFERLLQGPLGGYIRETEEFGYNR